MQGPAYLHLNASQLFMTTYSNVQQTPGGDFNPNKHIRQNEHLAQIGVKTT